MVAHVKFSPGGEHLQGSVRTLAAPNGVPQNSATSKALTVKIPAGATSAAIWFHNFTGAGSTCQAWDSNYNANYTYKIMLAADHPRCKGVQSWRTQHSDMPYAAKEHCLAYDIDAHHDATYCELHLSGMGQGYMGHYGMPQGWYEAYIHAPANQYGALLGAGMWVRYHHPSTGKSDERIIMARQHDKTTWQTGFIHQKTAHYSGSYTYQVQAMAFFIDVKRPSGKVVRLWQSRGGANYTPADAFTLQPSKKYIAYGNIQYANPGAGIFDSKRSCGK
jgi:hypothetical protein